MRHCKFELFVCFMFPGCVSLLADADLNGVLTPQYTVTVNITDGEFYDAKTITIDIIIVNSPAVFLNLPNQVRHSLMEE